jgi:DNA modification methylase
MRLTNEARCKRVAEIIAEKPDELWTVWCNTNYEADELNRVLNGAVEIRGSDKAELKEKRLNDFTNGNFKTLITKPEIAGRGLNWQHCANTIFCGLSYSFEDLYQALRRHYRFGQTREVNAYIVQADTEGPILDAVREKMAKHDEMKVEMRLAAESLKNNTHTTKMKTDINEATGTDWTLYHGDCVRVAREMLADDSVDFSIFSPPFADLFTYSDDIADMGNCGGMDDFMVQFGFLIDELMRVTTPGRECAVHCCDLLATKWKDGDIEFKDFSGAIVTAFRERGWLLHSKVTIWKDPVTEMQRTKAHGLLYKTLRTDSANVRVGAPEYLLVFRKPGKNPKPIEHTHLDIPLDRWQELASPVWMKIDQGNVLNGREARDERDERHICPLQLDVINNALTLWSAPNDLVFSPFTGIGSEGYCALQMGRRFVGAELKESYFKHACGNLESAKQQLSLL